MELPTPPSLLPWLNREHGDCACGRIHRVPVEQTWVGAGLIDQVSQMLPSAAAGPDLLLLADPDTWDAAGSRVAHRLREASFSVEEQLLPARPHADDKTLEGLLSKVGTTPDWVIAVGAGTVNDLGKMLAQSTGAKQLSVGTAASMNGYTSSIAAMTVGGLKLTLPAAPPQALLLDTDILARAPARLNAAGFGDLLSKPVSGGDWALAHWLFGEPLCPTAISVTDEAVQRCRAQAEAIGQQEGPALASLIEALLLSGIAMSLAGASSPASGGEHLISHYLDISQRGWGREPLLHGEQVAVGTLVSLALYEKLRDQGPPDGNSCGAPALDEASVRQMHRHLGSDALTALWEQVTAKQARQPDRRGRRDKLAFGWRDLWQDLDSQLDGSEHTARDLGLAGCPRRFSDINVDPAMACQTILLAGHMRNRYTVLDLAADLDLLEAAAEEISRAL